MCNQSVHSTRSYIGCQKPEFMFTMRKDYKAPIVRYSIHYYCLKPSDINVPYRIEE